MISAELALSDLSREAGLQSHAVKRFLCGVAFSEYLIGSHFSSSRDAALRERGRCRDLLAGEPLADGVVNTLKKQYFAGKECKHRRPLKYYDTGWIGGKLLFLSVQ